VALAPASPRGVHAVAASDASTTPSNRLTR
jgi:hypothetical protein